MYNYNLVFKNGRRRFLEVVNNESEIYELVDKICRAYGTEYLASKGVKFELVKI